MMGGGALNLVGSHVIDIVSFLTEKKAIKVHGVVRTYTQHTEKISGIRKITAPDFCCFQMELEGNILVTVNINSNISNNSFFQEVSIYGQNGHLTVRGGDLIGCRVKNESVKEEKLYLDVQDLQFATSESTLPRPYVKGLCKMVNALREAFYPNSSSSGWIKEPVQSAASFEDGLYVQAVLESIKKSSENKMWVKVNVMMESPTNKKLLNMNKLQFEREKLNFS
jgi:predicted dehydrogenase